MSEQSPTGGGQKRALWSPLVTKAFPNHADLIERAVLENLSRYERFGKWHMFWFRITGFLEILLSVSFPFVITLVNNLYPTYNGTVLFTGISIGIALVAGFRAFYSWNDNWKLFTTQRLAVSFVVRRWELALLPLTYEPEQNLQKALDATVVAVGDIERVLEHEQDMYFGGVELPEDILKRKGEAEDTVRTASWTPRQGSSPSPQPTHRTPQSPEVGAHPDDVSRQE